MSYHSGFRLITVSYIFLTQILFAQTKEFEELLSRERNLKSNAHDTVLANAYLKLAQDFMYLDSIKSERYFDKYYQVVVKSKDSLGIAKYHYSHAIAYIYSKDYLKAIESARACSVLTLDRDNFFYLESQQMIIKALYYLNRMEEAEEVCRKILIQNKFERWPVQLGKIYFNLGLVSLNRLNGNSSAPFYKAIAYLSRDPDNKVLLPSYHQLSMIYRDNNQLDSALRYAALAFRLSRDSVRYNNVDFIAPATNYQDLLVRKGMYRAAQDVLRLLQIRQYDLKVNSIFYPEAARKINYLEHLRYNEKTRFITVVIILLAILVIVFILFIFFRKLKQKKEELQESLELNEVLMRETNHRVKNNFQVMLSMISLNAGNSSMTIDSFVEQTRARIASMAQVHEMFLRNQAGQQSDIQSFFREVIHSLEYSMGLKEKNISIHFESEALTLKAEKMITLGLIINELIMNSVKYAFDGKKQGEIRFSVSKTGLNYVSTYSDNGPGIDVEDSRGQSRGMSIIFSLAKQLKGEVRLLKHSGAMVELTFGV